MKSLLIQTSPLLVGGIHVGYTDVFIFISPRALLLYAAAWRIPQLQELEEAINTINEAILGSSCQHTHQRFNRQQRRRVMTQVNPCFHDGTYFVYRRLRLVVSGVCINLVF